MIPLNIPVSLVSLIGVLVMLHPEGDLWKPIVALLLFGIAAAVLYGRFYARPTLPRATRWPPIGRCSLI